MAAPLFQAETRADYSTRVSSFRWDQELPEEIVNHIDDIAIAKVDQDHIVIIAHPAIRAPDVRQAILPGIVDPIMVAVIAVAEIKADVEAAIAAVAIRCVIAADPVIVAITLPVAAIIIAPVVAPTIVPAAAVVATIAAAPVMAAIVAIAPLPVIAALVFIAAIFVMSAVPTLVSA